MSYMPIFNEGGKTTEAGAIYFFLHLCLGKEVLDSLPTPTQELIEGIIRVAREAREKQQQQED